MVLVFLMQTHLNFYSGLAVTAFATTFITALAAALLSWMFFDVLRVAPSVL
jgi:uncharacterized oligopeptide transporter (OPT) family protein